MPIEIKELHVKGVVSNENKGGGTDRPIPKGKERELLVRECVEKVLAIIKQRAER